MQKQTQTEMIALRGQTVSTPPFSIRVDKLLKHIFCFSKDNYNANYIRVQSDGH